MLNRGLLPLLGLFCLGSMIAPARGADVVLKNQAVTVTISPAKGRIMGFALTGGANVLWAAPDDQTAGHQPGTGWFDWGGDKIWPDQQAQWPLIMGRGWPPDGVDGNAWTVVSQSARSLVMESAASPDLHVRVRRTITIDALAAKVTIQNVMTQLARTPFLVQIWSDTQVRTPQSVLMQIAPNRPELGVPSRDLFAGSLAASQTSRALDGLSFVPPTDKEIKIGTFGRWIAAVYPDVVFVQSTGFDPQGCYGDGANLECYSSARNAELETLSPLVHLQPNARLTNTVTWLLIAVPSRAALVSVPDRVRQIEELVEK